MSRTAAQKRLHTFTLRLPAELHRELRILAAHKEVSINEYVVSLIKAKAETRLSVIINEAPACDRSGA